MRPRLNSFRFLIGTALIVLLIWIAAGSPLYSAFSIVSHPARFAVLINNDPSERHRANLDAALQALQPYHFHSIEVLGKGDSAPALREVQGVLNKIQRESGILELLYITGHGSLVFNANRPDGEPNLMLRDRPLTPRELAPGMGTGPCAVYLDFCYAPAFAREMSKMMTGDFLVLSDKSEADPTTSCRTVSTNFWALVKEQSVRAPLWTAVGSAWKVVMPNGTRIRIGKFSQSDVPDAIVRGGK